MYKHLYNVLSLYVMDAVSLWLQILVCNSITNANILGNLELWK